MYNGLLSIFLVMDLGEVFKPGPKQDKLATSHYPLKNFIWTKNNFRNSPRMGGANKKLLQTEKVYRRQIVLKQPDPIHTRGLASKNGHIPNMSAPPAAGLKDRP